jgi:hypothetical protein
MSNFAKPLRLRMRRSRVISDSALSMVSVRDGVSADAWPNIEFLPRRGRYFNKLGSLGPNPPRFKLRIAHIYGKRSS